MDYSRYGPDILVGQRDGVAVVTFNRADKLNAMTAAMHADTGRIWLDFAADPEVRSVLITGAGRAFSVGGDYDLLQASVGDHATAARLLEETRAIAYNMTNLEKPIVSAINGYALGGGLAVAIMADISIAAEGRDAPRWARQARRRRRATTPRCRGRSWSDLRRPSATCSPATDLTGAEAERIGLISMAVPADELMPTAMDMAVRLAKGPPVAVGHTKRVLNQWLRLGGHTAFDYSAALETLGFLGEEVKEGLASLQEKRDPNF